MTKPIQFDLTLTKPFAISRCDSADSGDGFLLKAVYGDRPEIALVTDGSFEVAMPGPDNITLNAGDMAHPELVRGATHVTAMQDASGYVCLAPRHNLVWGRTSGQIAQGETVTLDVPDHEEAYLYVATGALDAGETGSLIALASSTVTVTAISAAWFIMVWR